MYEEEFKAIATMKIAAEGPKAIRSMLAILEALCTVEARKEDDPDNKQRWLNLASLVRG